MLTKAKDVYKDIDAGVWTVYVDVSCEVLVAVLTAQLSSGVSGESVVAGHLLVLPVGAADAMALLLLRLFLLMM